MRYSFGFGFVILLLVGTPGCEYNSTTYGIRETFSSKCAGKTFDFNITESDLASFPSWQPSDPSPLTSDKAVLIAQAEIQKYAKSKDGWELEEVSLIKARVGNLSKSKWMYIVKFERYSHQDYLQIPITLNGRAIVGKEQSPNQTH